MPCYTYILHSASADRYYVGSTCDTLEARLAKHNRRHKGYTSRYQPWTMVYAEQAPSKRHALAREREIKAWKSRARIEALIATRG